MVKLESTYILLIISWKVCLVGSYQPMENHTVQIFLQICWWNHIWLLTHPSRLSLFLEVCLALSAYKKQYALSVLVPSDFVLNHFFKEDYLTLSFEVSLDYPFLAVRICYLQLRNMRYFSLNFAFNIIVSVEVNQRQLLSSKGQSN